MTASIRPISAFAAYLAMLLWHPPAATNRRQGAFALSVVLTAVIWNRLAFAVLERWVEHWEPLRVATYVAIPLVSGLVVSGVVSRLGLGDNRARPSAGRQLVILGPYTLVVAAFASLPVAASGCVADEYWVDIVVGATIWPVSEEIVFRQGGLGALRRCGLSAPLRILLVSTVFCLYHIPQPAVTSYLDLFLTGVIFGLVFELSGSLTLCVAMHASSNATISGIELAGRALGLPFCT